MRRIAKAIAKQAINSSAQPTGRTMIYLRFIAEELWADGKGSVTGRAQRAEGKP